MTDVDSVTIYGSADDVIDKLRSDPVVAEATDIVANFSYFEPFESAAITKQIDVLAQQVGPALGWAPSTRTDTRTG